MLKNNMLRKNIILVGALIALILFLDQWLKIWVKTSFAQSGEDYIDLAGTWLRLTYVENQGMAFGTTFGSSIWAKLSLSIFRVFAIGGIAWYWYKEAKAGKSTEFLIAVGFVFAGAVGNLIDRLAYGHVIDFIDLHINNWHWPAFNVADSAIFIVVAMVLFDEFFLKKK